MRPAIILLGIAALSCCFSLNQASATEDASQAENIKAPLEPIRQLPPPCPPCPATVVCQPGPVVEMIGLMREIVQLENNRLDREIEWYEEEDKLGYGED